MDDMYPKGGRVMFRVNLRKLLLSVMVGGLAMVAVPIYGGGHGGGGGGHGGGGHGGGGGHMGGGGFSGGHSGGGFSGGHSGGSFSGGHVSGGGLNGGHGGGGGLSGSHYGGGAPSISHGGTGVSRSMSVPPSQSWSQSGTARSATHSFGQSGSNLSGHHTLGGTSASTNSGFAHRHFSANSASTNNSLMSRNSVSGLTHHSVARPLNGGSASLQLAHRSSTGFGQNGNNVHHGNNFHHGSNNNNWYNHPSRRSSIFLGFGSPFGNYWGYPGYNNWSYYSSRYWSPWYRNSFALGYGGYGYGGYGYGSYSPSFGYQSVCNYSNSYYMPASLSTTTAYADLTPVTTVTGPTNTDLLADPSPLAAEQDPAALGQDFATLGEQEFRGGRYASAVRTWRHALVDEPGNGGLMLLMAQALFATAQYDEAAGAVQLGMQMLPVEKWGTVVEHYRELYPKIGDYTTQLRALEKLRDEKPEDPAFRFLLGYHYGFLGYPKQGLKQLDKCGEVAPQDELAKKLQERMQVLLNPKSVPPKPMPESAADQPPPATPPATKDDKTP